MSTTDRPDPPDTRALLIQLREAQDLTVPALAHLTRSSEHAVRSWLRTPGSPGSRKPPAGLVELAYLRLGLASPFGGARIKGDKLPRRDIR